MTVDFSFIRWKWGVERWADWEFISLGWVEIAIYYGVSNTDKYKDEKFDRILKTLPSATPTLRGKDAERFIENMRNPKPSTIIPTPKLKEAQKLIQQDKYEDVVEALAFEIWFQERINTDQLDLTLQEGKETWIYQGKPYRILARGMLGRAKLNGIPLSDWIKKIQEGKVVEITRDEAITLICDCGGDIDCWTCCMQKSCSAGLGKIRTKIIAKLKPIADKEANNEQEIT